jgi:dihydrofolate synthase/folylpolyglutamate synthase
VLAFFNAYKKTIEQYQLTYFEISTALAFWWFAEQNVDWAVVETGLGGRLDATNVLAPEISVITTVGLDHADLLGDTLEEIAKEKAGIIKSNTPVVIGPDNQQVLPVIRSIAEKRESKLVIAEQPAIDEGSGSSNLKAVIAHQEWWFDPGRIPVIQLNNWSVVISVVHLLNDQLGTSVQKLLTLAWQSLSASDVFKACFEQLLPHWQWYFDGGHNQQAIHTLLQTVEQVKKSERTGRQWADKQPVFVLAAMKDKVSKKSFGQFAPYPNLYYYKLNQPRATQLADLKTLLPQIRPFPHQLEAQQKWLREMRDELVIFVGSFYFYRTVRDLIEPFAST